MQRFTAPLSGLFIFALASGYLMTLIPLKLAETSTSDVLAGLMGGIYYLGLLIGSFRSDRMVCRIGHIRAFAGFMALLCSSVLSLGLFDSISLWLLLRFINGIAVAGIFVVVESWLLCESTEKNRGRILAWYMVSLYGATALGQLFVGIVDSDSLMPFILIGALLALSIFPPVTTRLPSPEIEAPSTLNFIKLVRLTPSAVIGCFAGGMVLGALYSMLPLYLSELAGKDTMTGYLLAVTMVGGMILQYPVGNLSDYLDRRVVLVSVAALGCIVCSLFIWSGDSLWIKIPLLFLIGGATFTLYPLAISHGCDHLHPEDIVSGSQGLLLAYSVGSCLGPVIASLFMELFSEGLMLFFIMVMGLLGLFFLIRMSYRPAIYSGDEQAFVPVPRTTPVVAQIDPRAESDDINREDS